MNHDMEEKRIVARECFPLPAAEGPPPQRCLPLAASGVFQNIYRTRPKAVCASPLRYIDCKQNAWFQSYSPPCVSTALRVPPFNQQHFEFHGDRSGKSDL
ncbi:unnamed protein product [Boreogadus saida]